MKKKQSLREKGNAYQRWIRDWLWERDWIVRNFPMTSRPILIPDEKRPGQKKMIWLPQNNDVFGCDLIARKSPLILWIQSSLDDHIARRLEEFQKYFKYLNPWEHVMIFIKREKWHSIKNCSMGTTGVIIAEDLGRILLGRFTQAQGAPEFTFGEKIRSKKDAKTKTR